MSFDVTKPFCSKPNRNRCSRLYPRQKKIIIIKPTDHRIRQSIVVSHPPLNYYHDVEVSVVCITRASDLYTLEWSSTPGVSGTQNQLQH